MEVLVAGLVAGWAIALPLGAIGVLIVDRAIRLGFRAGAVAGAGTAAADGLYAAMAILAGPATVRVLAPARDGIELTGAVVLVAIGAWMAVAARRAAREPAGDKRRYPTATIPATRLAGSGRWRVGLGFFMVTLANPMTVVYFTGVVVSGLVPDGPVPGLLLFPVGALVASLSWQWLLAAVGALGGGRHPELGRWTRWVGAVAVAALGVRGVVLALA